MEKEFYMKRMLTLFHSLLLCLALMACAASPAQYSTIALARRDTSTDGAAAGEGLAVAFSVTAPLCGLEIECNITGENPSITMEIYKADTDYATTVAESPVRSETVTDLTTKLLWQFNPLEKGDYIVLFTNIKDSELIKSLQPSEMAAGKILHLRNGTVMTDGTVALTLFCSSKDQTEPALAVFTYPIVEE